MSRTPIIMLASLAGATAGFVVHQRQHAGAEPGEEVVVAAPPGNIAAAALTGLVLRSPVAAFAAGFSISALGGTKLDQMAAAWLRQVKSG